MRTVISRMAAGTCLLSLVACTTVQPGFIWGDNTSQWANDGDCDDPRFDGPWAHTVLLPEDAMHDANDCKMRYERGEVFLRVNYQPDVTYDNPRYAGPN